MSIAPQTKKETTEEARALVLAAGEGDASRVEALLAAGADVNAAAEGGETPLMRASAGGRLEVVKLLLDAGGDVHAKSENGFTPLFMSVFFGHVEVARLLLARGSDPSAPTRVNTTASEWARTRGGAEMVELLDDFDAGGARAQTSDGAGAGAEQSDAPPLFFPAGGEVRPVVPLSKIGGGRSGEVTTPPAETDGPEPDEATLVPAGAISGKSRRRFAHASKEVPRVSRSVTVVALVLSTAVGLIVGAYLIEPGEPVETRQAAPQPAATSSAPAAPSPTGKSVASANANGPDAGVGMKGSESGSGDDAETDVKAAAGPAPGNASLPRGPANDSRSKGHDTESPTQRDAAAEAHMGRPARAALRSSERLEPDAAKREATTKSYERAAERPAPAPPKGSLPVSSLPASAKSKQVIPWP